MQVNWILIPFACNRSAPRHLQLLKLRGGLRCLYLQFCRSLIEMADEVLSSSWRILEPYGCARNVKTSATVRANRCGPTRALAGRR